MSLCHYHVLIATWDFDIFLFYINRCCNREIKNRAICSEIVLRFRNKIMSKKRCKRKEVYLRVYSWARDALSFNVWCWKQSNKKKELFFLSKCICKGVNWGCIIWIIRKKCQRQMKWGEEQARSIQKAWGKHHTI